MNKFSKLAILVAFVAAGAFASMPQSASAATNCDAHGIGSKTMTNSTNNSAYTINGDKTTVTFDVSGCSNGIDISMISWKAPNGTTGTPYSKQVMFAHDTKHFSNGRHSMTISLPDCYFQVDTVTGTKLTGSTGEAYHYDARQVAFMHGGTKSCEAKPVVKTMQVCDLKSMKVITIKESEYNAQLHSKDVTKCTVTPTPTPQTPTPTVEAAATTEELPHTGPEAAIGTFMAASGAGTLVHRYVSRKSRR